MLKWLTPPKTGYFDGGAELELDQGKLAAMVESAYVAVAEIDAVNLKEACEGFGTDDDALTDILCFRTKAQLARIHAARSPHAALGSPAVASPAAAAPAAPAAGKESVVAMQPS